MQTMIKNFISRKNKRLEKDHPFFGPIVFKGSKPYQYWQSNLILPGCDEPVTIITYSNKQGPTESQVNFIKEITKDLNGLFELCRPVFDQDFERLSGVSFDGHWQNEFKISIIEIPADASKSKDWSVGYYVKSASSYFTAKFLKGELIYNEVICKQAL